MSQAFQASQAVQLILEMLVPDDRQTVLQRLNTAHGFKPEPSQLYQDLAVADRYGVHVRTVRNWIARGQLKGCQINGKWYSRADWMTEFEDQHVVKGRCLA